MDNVSQNAGSVQSLEEAKHFVIDDHPMRNISPYKQVLVST